MLREVYRCCFGGRGNKFENFSKKKKKCYTVLYKKGLILAAFLVLFKNNTFHLTKCESFITFIMYILHHSVHSVIFYSCLKVKILLHKSISVEQKCKNLELRGFAHLGKAFKSSLCMIALELLCLSKLRLEHGIFFYSVLVKGISGKYQFFKLAVQCSALSAQSLSDIIEN